MHQLATALQAHWPDVPAAVRAYESLSLPRANRIQAFSAECAGLEDVRSKAVLGPWASPGTAGLTPEQSAQRQAEFYLWVNQFPNNVTGDPESTYWKPLPLAQQQQQQ